MSHLLKKRSQKSGLPPGSLVHIGKKTSIPTEITLIHYDAEKIVTLDHVNVKTCIEYVEKPAQTWIHIQGIEDAALIDELGKGLELHPLMLEDIMNTDQRSKLDDYKGTLFIVLRMLKYMPDQKHKIEDEQISIVLGENFVISFTESKDTLFDPVIKRLNTSDSRIRRRHADFLCYCLIDCIVDHYFITFEQVDVQIDELEEELIHNPCPKTLQKIQYKKREINALRKAIWPLREVISRLQRLDTNLVKETTKVYLQDVYDHTIQIIDTMESFRDISASLLDMYMSTMTQKLNEVMKVLTVVSTLFVPLTFIASIYGMNFTHMPELNWAGGYYIVLGIMAIVASGMLLYFRNKKWI